MCSPPHLPLPHPPPSPSPCREQRASVDEEVQGIQDALEDMGVTRLHPTPLDLRMLEAEPEIAAPLKKSKSDLMKEDAGEESVEVGTVHSSLL